MIDARDRVVVGAPGPLTFWVFEVVSALARQARPAAVEVVQVDREREVPARPPGEPGRLLLYHYPNDQLIEAIERGNVAVLYLDEAPSLVVDYLVRATNRTAIEAIRVCSASYVANLALRKSQASVLARTVSLSLPQLLGGLSQHLGLAVEAAALTAYAAHVGAMVDGLPPLEAAIRRFLPVAAPRPDAGSSADDREASELVEAVLAPMAALPYGPTPMAIEWPASIFLSAERPTERAPRVVDLVGPARMLFHGPYLHLPPGSYAVELLVACASLIGGDTFLVQLQAGSDCLARVRLQPKASGGYRAQFRAQLRSAMPEVQLQVVAERGAIAGAFSLVRVRLVPETT